MGITEDVGSRRWKQSGPFRLTLLVACLFFTGRPCLQAQGRVEIGILRDGSLTLNGIPAAPATMGQRLEQIFRTRTSRIVSVKGDPGVEFQYVARSMDIARGSGIDITMITTPTQPGGIRVGLATTKYPRDTSLSVVRANNAVLLPWADGDDQLVVLVTRTGEIRLGPIPVKLEELASLARKAFAARVGAPLTPPGGGLPKLAFIKGDARAPWSRVMEVIDRLVDAGASELDFLVSAQ